METRAHHIVIGLFTVIVVAAALLFALWLGQTGHKQQLNEYDVVFEEAVTGLSQGSAVQFNGIKIGEVTAVALDPDDPRRVIARIRVSGTAPIRTDTHAELALQGITGVASIKMSSGSDPESMPLYSLPEEVPSIVAQPSPMNRFMSGGGDMVVNANELIIRAKGILSRQNIARFSRLLENLENGSEALVALRDDLPQTLRQLNDATAQAAAALTAATDTLQTANDLLGREGRQTLADARTAIAAFERSMNNLDGLIADNRGQVGGSLQSLNEIGPTLREMRAVLASLQAITRNLDDNPLGYLSGQPKAKEFQP